MYAQAEVSKAVLTPPSTLADPDVELQRRISNFLADRFPPSSSRLRVQAKNGVVTIRGTHDSFYHKQLCINCCQRVAGVVQLIDTTRVLPRDE